ncbi:MAG: hypothetical protein RR465_05700, partial [Mucinivorans sp.]
MELVSLVLNLVLGGSLIGMLLFYSSKRRREAAAAASAETGSRSDEFALHRQSIEFLSAQLQEAW